MGAGKFTIAFKGPTYCQAFEFYQKNYLIEHKVSAP